MTKKKLLIEIFEQTDYDNEKFYRVLIKRPFEVIKKAYDEFIAGEFCVIDCFNYIMKQPYETQNIRGI